MKRAAELDAAGWGPKKPKSAAAIWVNAPGVAVQVQQWERTVNRQPMAAVYPAGTHRSFSAAELVANRRLGQADEAGTQTRHPSMVGAPVCTQATSQHLSAS